MISFSAADHTYKSIIPDGIEWISVSTFIKNFVEGFNLYTQSEKSSKNKKSKWYKIDPEEIRWIWTQEAVRAVDRGTWYHKQEEDRLLASETEYSYGRNIPVFAPIMEGDLKIARDQKLNEGVYPEHIVFLKSVGVCGQTDRADIVNGHIHVSDHKTNKEIREEAYKSWDGTEKKMLPPLMHIPDCNQNHYALQMSIYAYIIQKHNPMLKVGDLKINHVKFEEEGQDKYGYPITRTDEAGNPIVKDVLPIKLEYMKREVELMFEWLKNNRDKLRTKKELNYGY